MIYLTLEEVLILHDYQITTFDGTQGIRDTRLLESAIFRPQVTFDGVDLYSDIFEKAAALIISVIKNHPFVDGNKRTGLHAMLVFLELNGLKTNFEDRDLVDIGLNIANSVLHEEDIIKLLKANVHGIYQS